MFFTLLMGIAIAGPLDVLTPKGPSPLDKTKMKVVTKSNKYAKMSVYYADPMVISNPRPIVIVVQNIGEKSLEFQRIGLPWQIDANVIDVDGKKIPRTRFGEKIAAQERPFFGGQGAELLQPGKTIEIPLDLQRTYDLTLLGKYRFSLALREAFSLVDMKSGVTTRFATVFDLAVEDVPFMVEDSPKK